MLIRLYKLLESIVYILLEVIRLPNPYHNLFRVFPMEVSGRVPPEQHCLRIMII